MPVKINSLEIENVKRIQAVALVGSVDELPADKQAGAWKAMAAMAGQIGRIVEAHTEGVRE